MGTTWELELPNGVKTPGGVWTKTVELSEMVGEDEDILADTTRAPGGKGVLAKTGSARITDILSRTTVRMGDETRPDGKTRFQSPDFFKKAWANAYTSDRSFAMVRLRQLSLGNDYVFSESCPECHKEIKRIRVALDELEVRTTTLDFASMDSHVVILPRSGDKVAWRMLRGTDEDPVEQTLRNNKSDFISAIVFRRIETVNEGKVPDGLNYLKRMSKADRDFLRLHFDECEGGIDTEIQVVCDGCSTEFTRRIALMGQSSFFFPSEVSTGSSTSALSPKPGDSPPKLSIGSP